MFWFPLSSNFIFIISSSYFVWLYFVVLNQVNWILCSLSFHLFFTDFYEFPIKFHIGFTDITLCSHCNLLLNCVTSVMTVSLSYLKAMSLPPKHTHTNVGVFVSDLCFCLFCFLEGGKASCCWSFYGIVIRKHNLFVFCFLKICWFTLWHKTRSLWGTIPRTGKAYILSRSRLRNGKPLNTNSYFFSPKLHLISSTHQIHSSLYK